MTHPVYHYGAPVPPTTLPRCCRASIPARRSETRRDVNPTIGCALRAGARRTFRGAIHRPSVARGSPKSILAMRGDSVANEVHSPMSQSPRTKRATSPFAAIIRTPPTCRARKWSPTWITTPSSPGSMTIADPGTTGTDRSRHTTSPTSYCSPLTTPPGHGAWSPVAVIPAVGRREWAHRHVVLCCSRPIPWQWPSTRCRAGAGWPPLAREPIRSGSPLSPHRRGAPE